MPGQYARINRTVVIGGKSFDAAVDVFANVLVAVNPVTKVPAGKTGVVAVRTSASVGTLTLATGHGVTTATPRLDLSWLEGTTRKWRRGCVVGTVATNSVPVTGGAGDDLPLVSTAIVASVPVGVDVAFTGDNAVLLGVKSDKVGQVTFVDDADVEIASYQLDAAIGQTWAAVEGADNPFAGAVPAKAHWSNGASDAAADMSGSVMYN